jgi:hypothetical protein
LYCDGLINVSKGIDEYIRKIYRLDAMGLPTTVIYSYCTEEMFIEDRGQKRADVVYEGGMRNSESASFFAYRNLEPIMYAFGSQNIPFHIYCKLEAGTIKRFEAAGATVHDGLPYPILLRDLSRYAWGWTGFNNDPPKKHIQYAMTNKFFEYMAAGTPILTYMTEEQNEVVEQYEFGIVVKKLKDIGEQIKNADWGKLHDNMLANRYEFTMEKQLDKLVTIYEQAAAYHEKHGNKYRVEKEIADYISYQYFPIKPEDWWTHK